MRKLDDLEWRAGITFLSYGVRVGIRVNEPSALERIKTFLPPGWKIASSPIVERLFSVYFGGQGPRPNTKRFSLLYGGLGRLVRTMNDEEIYATLESNLRLSIAEASPRRVFVHAGAVGWKGKAIVLPGRSYSGKTTLVAELLRAGATYYSDEYAVLDSRGRVHPFPKALSVRESSSYEQTDYDAATFGARTGRTPIPVGMVVVSSYKEGAKWRPRRLTSGQGVLELLANTVSARSQPEVALSALHQVASRASVLKGTRGEARQVVEELLQLNN